MSTTAAHTARVAGYRFARVERLGIDAAALEGAIDALAGSFDAASPLTRFRLRDAAEKVEEARKILTNLQHVMDPSHPHQDRLVFAVASHGANGSALLAEHTIEGEQA